MLEDVKWNLKKRKMKRKLRRECASVSCRGFEAYHRQCEKCGAKTCDRRMQVEPGTLRRYRAFMCETCTPARSLSRKRAMNDWLTQDLQDQYPGESRTAIRELMESKAAFSTPKVDVSSLNGTLSTLGLSEEMYAEQRSNESVLRRVKTSE